MHGRRYFNENVSRFKTHGSKGAHAANGKTKCIETCLQLECTTGVILQRIEVFKKKKSEEVVNNFISVKLANS